MSLARFLFLAVATVGVFCTFSNAKADVWETKAQWDDSFEDEFGNWIATLPLNYFKTSKYGEIATDCADAAYALRIIFAYEHGLPVSFAGQSELTNTTKRFDDEQDQTKKFRKFLRYALNETNTRTLIYDTYPIAINRRYLRSGAMYLNPDPTPKQIKELGIPAAARSGHVYYIRGVAENGMIDYVSSTVPVMVRDLQLRTEITIAPFGTTGGYRAWKNPGLADSQQSGISSEQFKFANWHPNDFTGADMLWDNWQAVIRNRLARRQATPKEEYDARVTTIDGYIHERANLVQKAWSVYLKKYHESSCMSSSDYDDYSTPSRDVKIQNELLDLRNAASKYLQSLGYDGQSSIEQLFAQKRYDIGHGVMVDLNQIWRAFQTNIALSISEPEHSPAVRWGLKPQGEWPCPENKKNYKHSELAQ